MVIRAVLAAFILVVNLPQLIEVTFCPAPKLLVKVGSEFLERQYVFVISHILLPILS